MLTLILGLLATPAFAVEIDKIVVCRSEEGSIPRDAELVYVEYARSRVGKLPEAKVANLNGVIEPVEPEGQFRADGTLFFQSQAKNRKFVAYRDGSFTVEIRMFGDVEVSRGRCELL